MAKNKLSASDWKDVAELERNRKRIKCVYCRDEGICHNCLANGLDGCMDCGYQKYYCCHCRRSRETCLRERGLA